MIKDHNFTIVDVETTGGSPFFNRVIEVGLIRVENGSVVEEFKQLFNPKIEIPEFITKMTGISNDDVEDAPEFAELASELLGKFQNSIFVAHNSQFDYGFIQEEFRKSGIEFSAPQLCTVKLSRMLFPEHKRHNLSELIERYQFECQNRHRAFDDAQVLWDFMKYISANVPEEQWSEALRTLIRKPRGYSGPKLAIPDGNFA